MRVAIFFILLSGWVFGQGGEPVIRITPRQEVSMEVLKAAQAAAQELCDEVVKGNEMVALDKMYLAWKKKQALKFGGMEKMKVAMLEAIQEQQAAGVKVTAMVADQPVAAWEVSHGIRQVNKGQPSEVNVGEWREWMVFVPTRKIVTVFDHSVNPPKLRKLQRNSYMAAICKKGGSDWSFIDGARLTAGHLRGIFPFLPNDDEKLKLPKLGGKVIE